MGHKLLYTAAACIGLMATVAGIGSYRTARAEQKYPPLGQFVTVDGRNVHYVQKGSGPHVILLHGAGGNLREWTFDLMGRLTDRYTVTAFDRPGLGYTDRVPDVATGAWATDGDSPQAQADMLRQAADTIGITPPVVVGHSFGGIVSYAWAVAGLDTDSPVNARAVVSLAGVAMPWPGDLGRYYTVNGSRFGGLISTPLLTALVPNSVVSDAIAGTFRPQPVPDGYADYIGAPLTLRTDSFRANIRQVNTLRPHVVTLATRYPELTLPIEIIHGTADTTVPLNVHTTEIAKIIDSVNITQLDGVGHMPHHSAPQTTIDAIDRAFQRSAP